MKYTKEEIEGRLRYMLYELLSDQNQEDGFISLEYNEETQECNIRMSVHIVEEDDYIGFGSY